MGKQDAKCVGGHGVLFFCCDSLGTRIGPGIFMKILCL